ncbi:MAG: hypothetical protein RIC15_02180 [Vicingaceae bacterium]
MIARPFIQIISGLALIIAGFISCSKEEAVEMFDNKEISEACLSNFYKYHRKVILDENFVDNQNGWNLQKVFDSTYYSNECDSEYFTTAEINNGLLLRAICSPQDEAVATFPLQKELPEYLGVEVHFNQFESVLHENVWIRQNEFRLGAGEFILDFAIPAASFFLMSFGGHTIHFLIPTRGLQGKRAYVYSDEFIEHYVVEPAKSPIVDEDISILAKLEYNDDRTNFIRFAAYAMISDFGPIEQAEVRIQRISIYQPLFPCN